MSTSAYIKLTLTNTACWGWWKCGQHRGSRSIQRASILSASGWRSAWLSQGWDTAGWGLIWCPDSVCSPLACPAVSAPLLQCVTGRLRARSCPIKQKERTKQRGFFTVQDKLPWHLEKGLERKPIWSFIAPVLLLKAHWSIETFIELQKTNLRLCLWHIKRKKKNIRVSDGNFYSWRLQRSEYQTHYK